MQQKKQFDNLQKYEVNGWKKGSTRFIEKGEKAFLKTKKNVRVERSDNGTFDNLNTY